VNTITTPDRQEAPFIERCSAPILTATVLICTYNRAASLGPTLDTIASTSLRSPFEWEVLVVDNNSSDDTRQVVECRVARYPVPLRYLFEPRQGKSNALNTGMRAAQARVIVFTDDDVNIPTGWLEAAVAPLLERDDIDYTGGPVRPMWRGTPPSWLDPSGNLGGTIAVKDHGSRAFVFEDESKTPLGVNMAVRRSLIERIGGFRPDLGRSGASLLGQEQAEFFYRSREAGARGLYVPEMVLDHEVPAARLTFDYFRRWWYWKGVSHSRLHRIHGRTELGLELSQSPRVAGLPRFIVRSLLRHLVGAAYGVITLNRARAAHEILKVVYAVGYIREDRRAAGRAGVRREKAEVSA
jgi:glycosyltransferase involved in cell wall biosynthesis